MSSRVVLVDDLDPESTQDVQTVTFLVGSHPGVEFEIDLSSENRESLQTRLQPFIDAARKTKKPSPTGKRAAAGARGSARGSAQRSEIAAIRAWANAQGHAVGDRGRIPTHVKDAYHASLASPNGSATHTAAS